MTKCLFNYFLYYQLELRFYYPPKEHFLQAYRRPQGSIPEAQDIVMQHSIRK